jgi:hypothetical protein
VICFGKRKNISAEMLQTQTQIDRETNKYSESLRSLFMFVEEL